MKRLFSVFCASLLFAAPIADAATTRAMRSGNTATERIASPIAGYTYNYMYPYLNNEMRTTLNPGVTTSQSTSPINAVVRTEQLSAPRRVVQRPTATTSTTARAAASTSAGNTGTARAAVGTTANYAQNTNVARTAPTTGTTTNNRRVVPRTGTSTARATRADNYYLTGAGDNITQSTNVSVSTSRCLADYIECMDGYCEREEMAYNRCYCSSKLAQIDSQHKAEIDNLIKKIITIQGTNQWSQEEMDEYWMSVIGKYTGENSWQKLEDALNIDWAATESRVRGQQSYTTGHEYCVRNLGNCFYMAGNMRDAYVSQITRDCQTYEQSLQRLKTALESLARTYE